MPRRSFLPIFLAAVLPTAGPGCDRPAGEVPRVEHAAAQNYTVVPFKDDAPPNATVPAGGFPSTFVDARGETVDLTKYHGQRVVLVVLRGLAKSEGGAFCPSCLVQVGGLSANREEFTKRNAEVLVVFPGPADRVGEFLRTAKRQTPGEPDWTFRLLLDQDCSACTRLGIRDDLAKPSTYILDSRGNVVYAYVGATSTDRPSVKALLTHLDRAE